MLEIQFFPVAEAANIGELIGRVNTVILNPLITFLFAAAVVLFLFGMVKFLSNRDSDSDAANTGKRHMAWGIVGMLIMVSVFGILQFIANTLGVEGIDVRNNSVNVERLDTSGGNDTTPVPGDNG